MKAKTKEEPVQVSEESQITLKSISKDDKFVFSDFGRFQTIDMEQKDSDPQVLLKEAIFSIMKFDDFNFEIGIYDQSGQIQYKTTLTKSLHYFINEND